MKLETVRCDLCGSEDYKKISMIPGESGDLYTIVQCKKCKLTFVNPQPTIQSLSEFYDQWFDDVSSQRREEDAQAMRDVYSEAYSFISKHFPGGDLLDVGCGYGCFMEYMGERGFEVYGTDYSSALLDYLSTLRYNVYQGDLDQAPFEVDKFHVISLFYVLEHVASPSKVLKKCFKLLKKTGIIYIRIPNYNLGRAVLFLRRGGIKISPKMISIICVPNHLFYFTPRTAAKMLESAGFQDIRVTSPMPTRRGNIIRRAARRAFYWSERSANTITMNNFIINPALTITGRK